MEFNCGCCGHVMGEDWCNCPNKPGPWDLCYGGKAYGCKTCGRAYWVHHSVNVTAQGEPCSGPECDGNLTGRVVGHPLAGLYNMYGTEHPNPPIPPIGFQGPLNQR